MRSLRFPVAFALLLAALSALDANGAMGVTLGIAWERSFSGGGDRRSGVQVLSVRRLVDNSLLVVAREGVGASAFRFGPDGTLLSSSSFYPSGTVSSAAVDPFGSVFLLAYVYASVDRTDLDVMKYDGLIGKKVWRDPGRVSRVPFRGPATAVIGPSGDVFVAAAVYGAITGSLAWATFCYDGRTGKALWGPIEYGDSPSTSSFPLSGGPLDVAVDPAGDVVVTGWAARSDRALWATIKYRGTTGERIWGPRLIGALSTAPPPTVCPGSCFYPPTAAKAAFDRRGDVFLTVSTFTAPYAQAWLTAKYDGATGNPIWGPVSHKTGTDTDYDVPSTIGVNGNGDVVVGGWARPSGFSFSGIYADELIKYSGSTGARIWGAVAVSNTISSLAFDGGGQVLVTGTKATSIYRTQTIWSTSSFDGRSGNKLWEQDLGSGDSDYGYSDRRVLVGPDGNVTSVTGAIVRSGADQHSELQVMNFAGATGSRIWGPVSVRPRSAATGPLALLVDGNGETVLVAVSGLTGSMLKYARDGRDLWGPVALPDALSPTGNRARAAIDLRGDVLLAGSSLSKYSGVNGRLLWGPIRSADYFESRAITTDTVGDVLLAGLSRGRWITSKYRGDSGDLLWSSFYDQPVNTASPTDISVDRQGDVLVTGYWYQRSDDPVWVTWKYSGSTGAPLWGPSLSGNVPAPRGGPRSLVIDANGDIIVTGVSRFYRGALWQKYSGITGATLWGPTLLPVGDIGPDGLVLDQAGDIFFVGSRFDDRAQAPITFWSAGKLSRHTGEIVWGPKDFLALRGSGSAVIALDRAGNVVVAGTVSTADKKEWALVKYDSSTGAVVFGPETYESGGIDQISQIKIVESDVVLTGNAEGLVRTARYGSSLTITTLQRDLAPASTLCGTLFLQSLATANGVPPLVWEVSDGKLPTGVELDAFLGRLSGPLSESGSFSFSVRVRDATRAKAERRFTVDVLDGGPDLTIEAKPEDRCLPGQYALSVPQGYASYRWSPGGETTPEITVCPSQPTIYSVTVTERSGCRRRGSIELQPFKIELVQREPLVLPGRKTPQLPPPRR